MIIGIAVIACKYHDHHDYQLPSMSLLSVSLMMMMMMMTILVMVMMMMMMMMLVVVVVVVMRMMTTIHCAPRTFLLVKQWSTNTVQSLATLGDFPQYFNLIQLSKKNIPRNHQPITSLP